MEGVRDHPSPCSERESMHTKAMHQTRGCEGNHKQDPHPVVNKHRHRETHKGLVPLCDDDTPLGMLTILQQRVPPSAASI